MSTDVYAKIRCAALHIKKALGIFRELIRTRRITTRVAFSGPPSGSKNDFRRHLNVLMDGASLRDSGMAFQMTGDE